MPDVQFILAGIPLSDVQIPERMPWGGNHQLTIHKLPGGKRVFDAMGPDNRPINWSGLFYGPTAVSIARVFDVIRQNGSSVTLQWGPFNFQVVVKTFTADFERAWQIPYQITCEVVADNSAPNSLSPDNVDDVVRADMLNTLNAAQTLGCTVPGDLPGPVSTLTGAPGPYSTAILPPAVSALDLSGVTAGLTQLRAAVAQVGSFVGITSTSVLPVSSALLLTRNAVSSALVSSEVTLGTTTGVLSLGTNVGVGGVQAGVSGLINASAFSNYAAVSLQASVLRGMGSSLARMQVNLAQGAS
jgi:hypothetical protein